MEARIQTRALPAVGWSVLLAILFSVVLDVVQDSKMDAMDDIIGNHTPVELG
jgi:hypothetical protein